MTDRHSALLFNVLCVLFAIGCVAGGGSSRLDVLAVIPIRILAIVIISLCILNRQLLAAPGCVKIMQCFAVGCGLVAIQLVPLPDVLWASLPGHDRYAQMARNMSGPIWRPLTLTPDLTLNALLALTIPAAAALCAVLCRTQQHVMTALMIVIGMLSGLFGLLQLSTYGADLQWYPLLPESAAIGLFANRNHHAVFLAALMPLVLFFLSRKQHGSTIAPSQTYFMTFGALLVMFFIAGAALATGSRFGIAAVVIAIGGSLALAWAHRTDRAARSLRGLPKYALPVFGLAAAVIPVGLAMLPESGVRRLVDVGFGDASRSSWQPTLIEMSAAFFPFGSGYGSFNLVYENFEPFSLLSVSYLNAAHNEVLQLAIEGGLAALVAVAAYLLWWCRTTFRIWRVAEVGDTMFLARAGTVITLICLLSSVSDYPLRTPLIAALFAIASVWMHFGKLEIPTLLPKRPSLKDRRVA